MEDLPPLQPAFSDFSPPRGKSNAQYQASESNIHLASPSSFFPSLFSDASPPRAVSPSRLITKPAAISRSSFQFPSLDQVQIPLAATAPDQVSVTTTQAGKPPRKKPALALHIPVRVSREEPPSTAPQEPIFPPEFLAALGVDGLHGKAVDQEFEDLLIQKGMKPSYTALSTFDKRAPDKLLSVNSIIASGASGTAYEILAPDGTSLLYKAEKYPNVLTDSINRGMAFWRDGDLSPAGLNLPHLVKTTFYFFKLNLPDGREEKFFVPADKVKEFAQHVPPDAKVQLEGQLMEKAPGDTLAQLLSQGNISFHPDDRDGHFLTIVKAVNEFLFAAYAHNFVHRDLKPENILYDSKSKTVTIIDTGEASHLGERDNPTDGEPAYSTKQRGTRQIMAPTMFEGKEYGSEVDFFSAGMLFLKLLQPRDAETFNRTRLPGTVRDRLFGQNPQQFLSIYLDYLRSGSDDDDSVTTKETSPATLESSNSCDTSSPVMTDSPPTLPSIEEILETHPTIKRLIELCFEASAGGSPEAQEMSSTALRELKRFVGVQL